MKIYGMKGRKVFAEKDKWAYVAEIEVEEDDGSETYVTVQDYELSDLTVSKTSMYDFLVGDSADPAETFLEEYKSWDEVSVSKYAEMFEKLRELVKMLGGC